MWSVLLRSWPPETRMVSSIFPWESFLQRGYKPYKNIGYEYSLNYETYWYQFSKCSPNVVTFASHIKIRNAPHVTRPDRGVKFTIHESGAIGAGMSPNGEYFVVGFKDRTTIYKTENGGVYRQIHLLGCNVIGVSFASNDSVAISCTNGQGGLYGLNGGKIRSL